VASNSSLSHDFLTRKAGTSVEKLPTVISVTMFYLEKVIPVSKAIAVNIR
jgi:hypothetical protein